MHETREKGAVLIFDHFSVVCENHTHIYIFPGTTSIFFRKILLPSEINRPITDGQADSENSSLADRNKNNRGAKHRFSPSEEKKPNVGSLKPYRS